MTNPQSNQAIEAYSNKRREWTRVDLLIALYDRAAESLERVASAIDDQDDKPRFESHARAILLMEQIVSGVDPSVTNFSSEIFRICEFAMNGLDSGDPQSIRAGAKAFRTLQEGFETVREEAIAMEKSGAIPPLETGVEVQG